VVLSIAITSQKEVAVAVGTTIKIVDSFEVKSETFPSFLVPASITFIVEDDATLTLSMELKGDEDAKLVIKGTIDGDKALNFYDEDANIIDDPTEISGTYVWAKVNTRNGYGWLAELNPAEKT
jgi:hypothetical protein